MVLNVHNLTIFAATQRDEIDVVRQLLEEGADVNSQNVR